MIQEINLSNPHYQQHYYRVNGESVRINNLDQDRFAILSWKNHVIQVLKDTFLPADYPHSVKPEYLEYQMWDAIQGLCSYLRSVITTKSVLAGAGVGNISVTPLAAAFAWVMKDGMGMVGSLTLAYYCVDSFEQYTKEWRLMADLLNNIGLIFDLLCSVFPQHYKLFIIISSVSKSCCGLIAGSTKARISAHFANKGHLADVNAKESTQETAIALIGLLLGMGLAKIVGNDEFSTWIWFLLFLFIHVYCNYRLMKTLVFPTFNPQRAYLLTSLTTEAAKNVSPLLLEPKNLIQYESIWSPLYLWFYGPRIGISLQQLLTDTDSSSTRDLFTQLQIIWINEPFLINLSRYGTVLISLQVDCSEESIVKAYFIGCFLMIRFQQEQRKKKTSRSSLERIQFLKEHSPLAIKWYQSTMMVKIVLSEKSEWEWKDSSALGVQKKRYQIIENDGKKDK
jgi:hypothetical protein